MAKLNDVPLQFTAEAREYTRKLKGAVSAWHTMVLIEYDAAFRGTDALMAPVRKHGQYLIKPALDVLGTMQEDIPKLGAADMVMLYEGAQHINNAIAALDGLARRKGQGTTQNTLDDLLKRATERAAEGLRLFRQVDLGLRLDNLGQHSDKASAAETRSTEIRDQLQTDLESLQEGLKALEELKTAREIKFKAANFEQRARKPDALAWAWLGATLVIAASIVFYAFHVLPAPRPLEAWNSPGNLSHFASRALIVSIASFLLVICARNAKAQRHNEVSNAHRATALTTFEMFRDASPEGKVDSVVLAAAVDAIFRSQPTGYGEADKGPPLHAGTLAQTFNPPQ